MPDSVEASISTAKVLGVGLLLLALVALSLVLSFVPLGGWSIPLALGIAAVKCAIVGAVYMELWEAHASIRLIFVVGAGYVVVLVLLASVDVATRAPPPMLPPVEARP